MSALPNGDVFLGFDPGGERRFGVAMVSGVSVQSATVSSVAEATRWAIEKTDSRIPKAAGIDTLLHWSDGPSGWRPADKLLRAAYPEAMSSVMAPNSLYGAMSIGGMALALRLRGQWPTIELNETHPKVLVGALGGRPYLDTAAETAIEWFANTSGVDVTSIQNGHQLDAVLSAWATRKGQEEDWPDLLDRALPLLFPAGPVTYLWPAHPKPRT